MTTLVVIAILLIGAYLFLRNARSDGKAPPTRQLRNERREHEGTGNPDQVAGGPGQPGQSGQPSGRDPSQPDSPAAEGTGSGGGTGGGTGGDGSP